MSARPYPVAMANSRSTRPRWVLPLSALAIAAVSLIAIEWTAGLAPVCPAIYPAPASCFSAGRDVAAVVGVGLVLALLAATLLVSVFRGRVGRRALPVLVGALGAVAAASPLVALGASGFLVDGRAGSVIAASVFCAALTVVAIATSPRRTPRA